MPTPAVFKAANLYDNVRQCDAGVSAGIDPLILQRNQLANARNVTVRGTFPTHRPPYVNIPLSFGGNSFQSGFEQGFFQGAGYYKPDFGTESIIVACSGRLFQIQIVGRTASVTEITISGDPQTSIAPQIWMWQAEKWMIVNDSFGLPVFFDGNASRRSTGAAASAGTISANFVTPAVGSTVAVTFSSAFSGPFNVPLRLTDSGNVHTGLFEAVATGGAFTGYPVTLKNLTDTSATEASGSNVVSDSGVVGTVKNDVSFSHGLDFQGRQFGIVLTAPSAYPVGTVITVSPQGFPSFAATIVLISSQTILTVRVNNSTIFSSDTTLKAGTIITTPGSGSTLVALLNVALTVPGVGVSTSAIFDRAYAGALPQAVYINGRQYQITAVSPPAPNTAVTLLNLTAAVGMTFAANIAVTTLSELQAGRMGCYGLGRVWEALTDGRSFIGGDIVGGSSGTATYQKRDAVLRVQENDLLNGGGSFVVPGQVGDIRAMLFTSVLDASLGQGPLAVCTPTTVFSCQAPTDRTTWQNLVNPILTESMKGGGGLGQNSTIIANSDVLMRSLGGIRSYIQGRRDFDVWGNVPISREVDPFLQTDDPSLLPFGSAIEFDNRMLMTNAPVQSAFGVYWTNLIALNFDAISSLRGKAPSVYDGVWDGLNILQVVKGSFAGVERAFAVCVSSDLSKIELWEILKSNDSAFQDNNATPIQWRYETAALNFYEQDARKKDFLRLLDGELRVDQMNKTLFGSPITVPHAVRFELFYKPDQWPDWVPWNSWTENFDPLNGDPGFRPTMGVGEPSAEDFDETNDNPLREFTTAQLAVQITGHCRVVNNRLKGTTVPEPDFAPAKTDH